jgi:hypothetical protein
MMRRGLASWPSLCAALAAVGCASTPGPTPEAAAREQLVERALAVLRQQLDVPVQTRASRIERVLPPAGSVTPDTRQLLFEHEMVWLGVHELIGFGENRARIESILARLAFDEHGPYFPAGIEGHPAQVVAELSRLGVDPAERFTAGTTRTVTPADLVQSARDRYDHASVGTDPAWLIEAVTYGRDPTQAWVNLRGDTNWVHGYILGRLRVLGETSDLNAMGLAEGGLHFAESLARLVPRLAQHPDFGQEGSTREAVNLYLRFLEWYQRTMMERWLDEAARNLEPAQQAFRSAPDETTAQAWLRRLRDAGHILEMVHDPASWFDDRISPIEQGAAVEKLAEAVLRWYSPDFEAARAALDGILDTEGRSRALLCAGQMMHAHHALALWLEDNRESALGPAPVVSEGIVALPHRFPETDLARSGHEVEPLLGVASHAVEQGPQRPARREAHVLDGLVAE